jgi:hypothetical protein
LSGCLSPDLTRWRLRPDSAISRPALGQRTRAKTGSTGIPLLVRERPRLVSRLAPGDPDSVTISIDALTDPQPLGQLGHRDQPGMRHQIRLVEADSEDVAEPGRTA